jgi:hypothetical protein
MNYEARIVFYGADNGICLLSSDYYDDISRKVDDQFICFKKDFLIRIEENREYFIPLEQGRYQHNLYYSVCLERKPEYEMSVWSMC